MSQTPPTDAPIALSKHLSSAEIGALAHLYRGEVYRSTIWRTRLDATTNWSVVSLGISLSLSYSGPDASALPLMLVAALIFLFLWLESRRYRYFNVWRARARWMEIHFYAPLLCLDEYEDPQGWQKTLADDYREPEHHISFRRAFGRRLRRNYLWIFAVQALAFYGKVIIHPAPAATVGEVINRMAMGPIPGLIVFTTMAAFHLVLVGTTYFIWRLDRKKHRERKNPISMG